MQGPRHMQLVVLMNVNVNNVRITTLLSSLDSSGNHAPPPPPWPSRCFGLIIWLASCWLAHEWLSNHWLLKMYFVYNVYFVCPSPPFCQSVTHLHFRNLPPPPPPRPFKDVSMHCEWQCLGLTIWPAGGRRLESHPLGAECWKMKVTG